MATAPQFTVSWKFPHEKAFKRHCTTRTRLEAEAAVRKLKAPAFMGTAVTKIVERGAKAVAAAERRERVFATLKELHLI